jgi:hypothetical protein
VGVAEQRAGGLVHVEDAGVGGDSEHPVAGAVEREASQAQLSQLVGLAAGRGPLVMLNQLQRSSIFIVAVAALSNLLLSALLISLETHARLGSTRLLAELGAVTIRGKAEPVRLFTLARRAARDEIAA